MRSATPSRKQTFLWQGVLILLPVLLMAGFGFWAILRERNAVDQEARQQAEAILQSLQSLPGEGGFGRIAASRLTHFVVRQSDLLSNTLAVNFGPNDWAAVQSSLSVLHVGAIAQVGLTVYLNSNGDLEFGHPTSTRPPAWLATLSDRQYQAWAALQTAACVSESSSNLDRLTQVFQQTQPPASALACADFWRLCTASASLPATNAIRQMLRFADDHDEDISDSGVPLRTLALAAALRRARECGPSEPLWAALQTEVASPGVLTPRLLDEAGRLVATDALLSESINAMRSLLSYHQAQAGLAEALKQTGRVNGIIPTNLWMQARDQHWFCLLQPVLNEPGNTVSRSTTEMGAQCYPLPLVARAFADAFQEANVALPDYFGISVELAGEPVVPPAPWGKSGPGKSAGDLLAAAPFQMSERGGIRIHGSGQDIFFDDMLSHPQFALQIRLTDRPLLYARQRRLQWVFGSMVAASALAALVGFLAAFRAFRRQQELGELKSNFVSSVSHELRAPIASVRLMAENLDGGKIPEPARRQEYYQFIVQECRRLSSLIENVLDFSRIEQGRKQYEFEPTDLLRLTRTTVHLMEPYAKEKGVTLRLAAPERRSPTGLNRTTDQSRQEFTNGLPPAVPGPRPPARHSFSEGGSPGTATDDRESRSELPQDLRLADVSAPGTGAVRDEPVLELNVDGRAIQQALVNLLDNAIKHSAKGETVTVGIDLVPPNTTVERRSPTGLNRTDVQSRSETGAPSGPRPPADAAADGGDSPSELPKDLRLADVSAPGTGAVRVIHLWVADQGPGIPAAEHERIFERFYRRGSELRRETQGIGIGLSIVKHIMTAHGGRVLVDSAPGRGSRFTLELPAPQGSRHE